MRGEGKTITDTKMFIDEERSEFKEKGPRSRVPEDSQDGDQTECGQVYWYGDKKLQQKSE